MLQVDQRGPIAPTAAFDSDYYLRGLDGGLDGGLDDTGTNMAMTIVGIGFAVWFGMMALTAWGGYRVVKKLTD
jgi:hypothetical protein